MNVSNGNPLICRKKGFMKLLLEILINLEFLNENDSNPQNSFLSFSLRRKAFGDNLFLDEEIENTVEEQITQLSQVTRRILITNLDNQISIERVVQIILNSRDILHTLELLEEYFKQGQINTARVKELEDQIEIQISDLLKILLYLPEQPQE